VLTRIKLIIDDQPGTLMRVIGGLRRTSFNLENHRVARSDQSDHYQVGLKLRGEPLPLPEIESFLMSIEGVVQVSKVRAMPYDEIHYDRTSSGLGSAINTAGQSPFRVESSVGIFTHLLSPRLLQNMSLSWADTGDSEHVMALVDHIVAAYPQTPQAIASIEHALRRDDDRNLLLRNLGVRVGRRVSAMDHRSTDVEDPVILLDRLVIGYLYPFAQSRLLDGPLESDADIELVVDESAFAYRRGRTLKIGGRRDTCSFLEGFIDGALDHSDCKPSFDIQETSCLARGAKYCLFECREKR